jgi:hypothetical protein
MSCSVNLVPLVRLQAQARNRRRLAWVGTCTALGLLLTAGWGIQRAAAGAVSQLSTTVGALQIQRTEVQRRLLSATAQRTRLLDELKTVAAARRPQPWPRRFVTLSRIAPEGVFLTNIDISTPDAGPAVPVSAPPAKTGAAPSSPLPASPAKRPLQVVHLRGYAVNHDALVELLNALQKLPDWPHVELVRANLEPRRDGTAVAFELDCRTVEGEP